MTKTLTDSQRHELWRKSFHALGIVMIPVSQISPYLVVAFLVIASVLYLWVELLARTEHPVPFVTTLIRKCKRPEYRDTIDCGPLYLAAGVGLPFLLLPVSAASVALLHACVADAAAAVAANLLPRGPALPHSARKSVTGTLTFFIVAWFLSAFYFPWQRAFMIAVVGTVLESLPPRDLDNIIVPVGVALFIFLVGWT